MIDREKLIDACENEAHQQLALALNVLHRPCARQDLNAAMATVAGAHRLLECAKMLREAA